MKDLSAIVAFAKWMNARTAATAEPTQRNRIRAVASGVAYELAKRRNREKH